jgi:hypothetical protein
MANNEFLVSVARAIARDPNTGRGVFLGKTNITSAFTVSMTPTEVRGGALNPLLYVYYHDRKVEIKIESATYDKTYLGVNVGQLPINGTVTVMQTECITLVGGVGTLAQTPLSDVVVFMPDGTIQNVTPSGKSITVTNGAALSVDVAYDYSTTADQIIVSTTTPPLVLDMTLIAEVRDSTGVITKYLQIQIPRFQTSGNNTLSLAANGVSNQTLDGYALTMNATDCTGGDYYAKITEVTATAAGVATSAIVALPSTLVFSKAVTTATKGITALAIKGTATATVTTSCSFVTTSASWAMVGLHTGQVTVAASAVAIGASGSVVVTFWDTISSASYTDSVNLSVTA